MYLFHYPSVNSIFYIKTDAKVWEITNLCNRPNRTLKGIAKQATEYANRKPSKPLAAF